MKNKYSFILCILCINTNCMDHNCIEHIDNKNKRVRFAEENSYYIIDNNDDTENIITKIKKIHTSHKRQKIDENPYFDLEDTKVIDTSDVLYFNKKKQNWKKT